MLVTKASFFALNRQYSASYPSCRDAFFILILQSCISNYCSSFLTISSQLHELFRHFQHISDIIFV